MTDDHRAYQELLPWYVNGTLDEDERVSIEHHLGSCQACRNEIDSLEELRLQIRLEGDTSLSPEETGPKIEAIWEELGKKGPLPKRTPWSPTLRWLVASQAAAIVILTTMLIGSGGDSSAMQEARDKASAQEDAYQTLSAPAESPIRSRRILVVFREHLLELEMRQLLLSNGVEIVSGPNQAGAYLLAPSRAGEGENQEKLVVRLRGDPRIILAEPAGPRDAPPLPR